MEKHITCSCGQVFAEYEPNDNLGICFSCMVEQIKTLKSELQQCKEALRLMCESVESIDRVEAREIMRYYLKKAFLEARKEDGGRRVDQAP